MSERDDCFDELFELANRFVSNEETAFDRLVNLAAGDSPPMDEHGNYIDDFAKLDQQRKNDGLRLLQCIAKCFDFEKEYGYGAELLDALKGLEKAVSSLNEWEPEVDLRVYESDEACWQGGLIGVGWDRGKAKLKASIELVEQSLEKLLRLRMRAREKACAASTGETLDVKRENPAMPPMQTPSVVATRKPGINARMLESMQRNPESRGWSASRWAKHLKCAKSSIASTPTWKELANVRELAKAERAADRRQNGRTRRNNRTK